MCYTCIRILDDELMKETTSLRLKLNKEEKRLITYMNKIATFIQEGRDLKWENHDCLTSQVRVLGVAKAKKLGIFADKSNSVTKKRFQKKIAKTLKNQSIPTLQHGPTSGIPQQ
jgi:hypothetical protein